MTKYFNNENIPTLADVLFNRDQRENSIKYLGDYYKDASILCFKLNIPGPQKNNQAIKSIFNIGVNEIQIKFIDEKILFENIKDDFTGPEYFLVIDKDPISVKKKMVDLEENSYFGRLYDIDIKSNGRNITRELLGMPSRTCFICDNDAKICARSRAHSVDEMINFIEIMIDNYNISILK